MKKFYITNPETTERYAVLFDFKGYQLGARYDLGFSYIMETGGNPITDNDDDAPTLAELMAQATSEIMNADENDREHVAELCEAWFDETLYVVSYAVYTGENLACLEGGQNANFDNDEADWFDTLKEAVAAAYELSGYTGEPADGETCIADIMKFQSVEDGTDNAYCGDRGWDFYLELRNDGRLLSDDAEALEELPYV